MKKPKNKRTRKAIESLTHEEARRKNIPTAEYQSVMQKEDQSPLRVAYERRNRDLDPQFLWRGKDAQDWSELLVPAPPLYIQEKVHPKALIDDLLRRSDAERQANEEQADLFADFNGLPDDNAKTEFYRHDANWSNRMILGDSLQVMASLAEREGLRGQVQCIYLDPPYGIKFNSNFQWSTTSRDVKDGKIDHITREPEQVKAFRDTWRDGIHSYLTYLRDRLTVARDLLTDSGSIFVQIGDENVHRVRALMDEVFGEDNFVSLITFRKKNMPLGGKTLENMCDYLIWYARNKKAVKYHQLWKKTEINLSIWKFVELGDGTRRKLTKEEKKEKSLPAGSSLYQTVSQVAPSFSESNVYDFEFEGKTYRQKSGQCWVTTKEKMQRLSNIKRIQADGNSLRYVLFKEDFLYSKITNPWMDLGGATSKKFIVETSGKIITRCLLMTTDPGDIVLDPTCGSGTTAFVAEQWGRRWITIDTSRVALALARARVMGARYPYYLLADSPEGLLKEAEITCSTPSSQPTCRNIRHGFVYERVPHITLKSIANNDEIDVIWDRFQESLEPLRTQLNEVLNEDWEEWGIPRKSDKDWPKEALELHRQWWEQRIARQKEIDASIAAKADTEYLYDKPYEDKNIVRVAGPFTVESLSPHRVLGVDEDDELIDSVADAHVSYGDKTADVRKADFVEVILENLKTAGVQQASKEDKIDFTSLTPWPGTLVCAQGYYVKGVSNGGGGGRSVSDGTAPEKRAAIFIGPEFGTVSRPDLVAAAREAGESDFDILIACAFNYDAHSSEFDKLGRIPILRARMNADLHMAEDLKNTGKGNLFVIFGEPDIDIIDTQDGQIRIKVKGVDVFHPQTGEIRSAGADGIACWFIDTDYNEESFFVRHAYFLGADDPYKALKTTLKAEIDEDAWTTLHSDTSRPFAKPESGRIAVKVINHLGDEVMKVFRVD